MPHKNYGSTILNVKAYNKDQHNGTQAKPTN